MEAINTLDYLRLLNESNNDNIIVNNKNIIGVLLDCIDFNQRTYIEKDKYLYIYNYVNIFREYYDIMKETIQKNYNKLNNNITNNNNNELIMDNEIELIKYYRSKIFKKELELRLELKLDNEYKYKNEVSADKYEYENEYKCELYDNVDTYMNDMCNLYEESINNNNNNVPLNNNNNVPLNNNNNDNNVLLNNNHKNYVNCHNF